MGASHLHGAYQVLSGDKGRLYLTRTDELPADRMPGKQAGMTMDQGRYGAFETTEGIAPGRYRVTLTVAGEKRYQVDAGEIEI